MLITGDLEHVVVFPSRVLAKLGARRLEPGGAGAAPSGERGDSGLACRVRATLETVDLILGQPQPLVADADLVFACRAALQGKPSAQPSTGWRSRAAPVTRFAASLALPGGRSCNSETGVIARRSRKEASLLATLRPQAPRPGAGRRPALARQALFILMACWGSALVTTQPLECCQQEGRVGAGLPRL